MKQCIIGILAFAGVCMWTGITGPALAFGFNQPEISLVEPDYDIYVQSNVNVTFDPSGNVHVVYQDDRVASNQHIFATSYTSGGALTPSYRAYQGIDTDTHILPFVFPSGYYSDRCYVGGILSGMTSSDCIMGYFDTTSLPAIPPIYTADSYTLATSTVESVDMIAGGFFVFLVYNYNGTLYFNTLDQQTGTWASETNLTHQPRRELHRRQPGHG
ncbi:MAG TPA: hypothetical protein PLV45_14055 [bacterium]|nr:hypothetical protein [bacterium]